MIDWSHQRPDEPEQALFRRLATLVGAFDPVLLFPRFLMFVVSSIPRTVNGSRRRKRYRQHSGDPAAPRRGAPLIG
jgi:hypothetical protein